MFFYRKIDLSVADGRTHSGLVISMTGADAVWFVFPDEPGTDFGSRIGACWPAGADQPATPSDLLALLPPVFYVRALPVLRGTSFDTAVRMVNNAHRSLHIDLAAEPARETVSSPIRFEADDSGRTQRPAVAETARTAETVRAEASGDVSGVAIKNGYTRENVYHGREGYHGYHGLGFNQPLHDDKPWRIGIELELYARNDSAKNTILNSRSNWYQCERDGSLTESIGGRGDLGIEMKTIPLRACDAKDPEFWREPITRLKQLAVSCGHHTTGLHVHIGKEIFGSTPDEIQRNVANLNYFYVHVLSADIEALAVNDRICGRTQGYGGYSVGGAESDLLKSFRRIAVNGDIRPFVDALNETAQNEIRNDLMNKCRAQRWDINIKPLSSYGTVEFRKGDGRISATRICALVSWWESMALYCNETPWREMNFNDFRRRACAASPAVAAILMMEEEA